MIDEVYSWFEGEPQELQDKFLDTPKENLVVYHNTLGRSIRNHFKLWETEWEPEYETSGNLKYDKSSNHPDNFSMKIIETVWDRAQKMYR